MRSKDRKKHEDRFRREMEERLKKREVKAPLVSPAVNLSGKPKRPR
jgi:hypothetical protein